MPHRPRPDLSPRHPVHVTLRVRSYVWRLRSRRCFRVIHDAFVAGCERLGIRVTSFCVQANHLHLVLEAEGREALSRGMQGLSIRIAKALNRVMGRRGAVFEDRFHAHVLRTLAEVKNALRYIEENAARHAAKWRGGIVRGGVVRTGVGRGRYSAAGGPGRLERVEPRGSTRNQEIVGGHRGAIRTPDAITPRGTWRSTKPPPPDSCALGYFVGRVAAGDAGHAGHAGLTLAFVRPRTWLLRTACFNAPPARHT